jgi:seryl-tRNA synthetase
LSFPALPVTYLNSAPAAAMLDIRIIREQPELIKRRLAARGGSGYAELVDQVLACDTRRRRVETELQACNGRRNRLSKEIGQRRANGEPSGELETEVRGIGEQIASLNREATAADEEQRALLLEMPNLPHAAAPPGDGATDNPVVRTWGVKPSFEREPEDHLVIGTRLGLFDPERAAKISGSGFACFTGAGARLERSLINFLLDLHTGAHGYQEVSPPFLVRRECMVGTSQLPKFEEDMYGLEDNSLFLTPTAEVPVTNLHREEILAAGTLPRKLAAYTPCFRREAGSAGRDTRGLIRLHQFDKVELVKIVAPETSYAELESLTADAEKVLQLLGLHYRVIELCTGDLGFGSAKTYDIEVWAPAQKAYLEVSSCSNFEDFQARRMNLKFKDPVTGKNRFCHTLNGSGTALPRLYVALLESCQLADGTLRIPELLQDYFRAKRIG